MGRPPKELAPQRSPRHRLGAELRNWREARGWSQARLGREIHHSGAMVGKVEKAERAASLEFFERADQVLETGGVLTRMWRDVSHGEVSAEPAVKSNDDLVGESLQWVDNVSGAVELSCRMWRSEVDRRTVLASAAWVSGAFAAPFRSWLRNAPDVLVGGPGRTVGRAVGRAEVEALWSMCASFSDADHRLGGGYARSTLVHYLDAVVRPLLIDGAYGGEIGRELMAAVARLCNLCAFMSFDSGEHGLAQRYFVQALRLAHASGNRALAAHVLGDMSMQAHHLNDAER